MRFTALTDNLNIKQEVCPSGRPLLIVFCLICFVTSFLQEYSGASRGAKQSFGAKYVIDG